MCFDVLHNPTWYIPIPQAVIDIFINEFRELCTGAFRESLIDRNTLNYLVIKFSCTSTFYTTPPPPETYCLRDWFVD